MHARKFTRLTSKPLKLESENIFRIRNSHTHKTGSTENDKDPVEEEVKVDVEKVQVEGSANQG